MGETKSNTNETDNEEIWFSEFKVWTEKNERTNLLPSWTFPTSHDVALTFQIMWLHNRSRHVLSWIRIFWRLHELETSQDVFYRGSQLWTFPLNFGCFSSLCRNSSTSSIRIKPPTSGMWRFRDAGLNLLDLKFYCCISRLIDEYLLIIFMNNSDQTWSVTCRLFIILFITDIYSIFMVNYLLVCVKFYEDLSTCDQ